MYGTHISALDCIVRARTRGYRGIAPDPQRARRFGWQVQAASETGCSRGSCRNNRLKPRWRSIDAGVRIEGRRGGAHGQEQWVLRILPPLSLPSSLSSLPACPSALCPGPHFYQREADDEAAAQATIYAGHPRLALQGHGRVVVDRKREAACHVARADDVSLLHHSDSLSSPLELPEEVRVGRRTMPPDARETTAR
ncbi:hypothetical protein B0H19DRAFT_1266858 [Mycena capillaripes]|nr:hypothetical protein B0H19DRAFT_1266858 [Mycena capillaripes]